MNPDTDYRSADSPLSDETLKQLSDEDAASALDRAAFNARYPNVAGSTVSQQTRPAAQGPLYQLVVYGGGDGNTIVLRAAAINLYAAHRMVDVLLGADVLIGVRHYTVTQTSDVLRNLDPTIAAREDFQKQRAREQARRSRDIQFETDTEAPIPVRLNLDEMRARADRPKPEMPGPLTRANYEERVANRLLRRRDSQTSPDPGPFERPDEPDF